MLTIRQLKILEAIVESGSVTAAAQKMHVTQPAVSKTLSALETYVGFEVFERRKKRLILTDQGQSLYGEARRLLGMVDDFDQIVDDIKKHGAQRLRLATTQVIGGARFLADALAEFYVAHPNLHVEVETMQRQQLVRTAIGDRADVVIGNLPFTSTDVVTSEFGQNRILAIAKKGTFLTSLDCLTAADLSQLPVIFLFERSRLRRIFDHYMYRAGVTLQIRAQVASSNTTIQFARSGLGVGICDGLSLINADLSGLDVCVFDEPLSMGIGFLRRNGDTVSGYRRDLEQMIVAHWEQQEAPFYVT